MNPPKKAEESFKMLKLLNKLYITYLCIVAVVN